MPIGIRASGSLPRALSKLACAASAAESAPIARAAATIMVPMLAATSIMASRLAPARLATEAPWRLLSILLASAVRVKLPRFAQICEHDGTRQVEISVGPARPRTFMALRCVQDPGANR